MSNTETNLEQFFEAFASSVRPTGMKFVWGRYPEDDPRVKQFQEIQREAETFKKWHEDNPVQLTASISKESIGAELNRAIARAPNIASPKRQELLEGAFIVLDIDDKQEYEKFRRAHWLYSQRTEILVEQSKAAASQSKSNAFNVGKIIAELDSSTGYAQMLPGLTAMLRGSGVFTSSEDPEPENMWALIVGCAALIGGGLYMVYKTYENFITGTQNKHTDQVNRYIKDAQGKNRDKIEQRSEDAEEAMRETTNAELLLEREACMERERTHSRIMDRVCDICDEKHGIPGFDDPHLRQECIRRGASELKDRIQGGRQELQGLGKYSSFTSAMLNGDIFDISQYLSSINDSGEVLRSAAMRSIQMREQNIFSGWTSLQYPDIFDEDSRLWF